MITQLNNNNSGTLTASSASVDGDTTFSVPGLLLKYFTMTTELKTRKPRTPRNTESVTKGALALPLQERVDLMNALEDSIQKEVDMLKEAAAKAEAIANQ